MSLIVHMCYKIIKFPLQPQRESQDNDDDEIVRELKRAQADLKIVVCYIIDSVSLKSQFIYSMNITNNRRECFNH